METPVPKKPIGPLWRLIYSEIVKIYHGNLTQEYLRQGNQEYYE